MPDKTDKFEEFREEFSRLPPLHPRKFGYNIPNNKYNDGFHQPMDETSKGYARRVLDYLESNKNKMKFFLIDLFTERHIDVFMRDLELYKNETKPQVKQRRAQSLLDFFNPNKTVE